jgi:hypothetical protein
LTENIDNKKKIIDIINSLELLKEQINKLEMKILRENYNEDLKNVFNNLRNSVNEYLINSVILYRNQKVKYISEDFESNGYKTLFIYENKGYIIEDFDVLKNKINIRYFYEYNIPDNILDILEKLPEGNIDLVESKFFKLYHILQKHYQINLVKV